MKKLVILLLAVSFSFLLLGCQNKTTEASTTTTTQNQTTSSTAGNVITTAEDLPSALDLLDEAYAVGQLNGDSGLSRIPLDPNYSLLLSRKEPLDVGQTYTEAFEEDYLHSRIYPYKADSGASYSMASNVIEGKSLVISTEGDYAGIYLNGMSFSANSSYQISFDYRFLSGTSEFFFQFRSITGGSESDLFANINNNNGNTGSYEFQADLGNYSDYEIMIFPRFDSGVFAIDNISITRIDSKPLVKDGSLEGTLAIGESLSLSYQFYDSEGQAEGDSQYVWFSAMDTLGKDKELVAENTETLTITNDMAGKYIICQVTPVSTGATATNNIGNPVYIVSDRVPGDLATQVTINLAEGESFTEDFESDTDSINNLIFAEHDGAKAYIKADNNNKSLYIESDLPYSGVTFEGISFSRNQVYQVSFDYKILEMPSNIYVQARTLSGWVDHDKYYDIPLSELVLGENYHFEGNFGLDGYDDYFLMIFFGGNPGSIVIDNLTVTATGESSYEVTSVELAVGEYLSETFDEATRYLGFDFAQVPNSGYTSETGVAISGNSLSFASAGNYLTLFINKGLIYTANATYRVEFDYRIISLVDTVYVQFNGGSYGNIFTQFGDVNQINQVNHFSYDFTLANTTNYIIQIFPGGSVGETLIIIDNIKIERIS